MPACMSVHDLLCMEVQVSMPFIQNQQLSEGFRAVHVVMPIFENGLGNAELAQGEEGNLLHEGLEVGGGSASNAISQVTGPQVALVDNTMLQCALSESPARQASGPGLFRITEFQMLKDVS